ncbi:hypothetical protein BBJ28_00002296 [Nothophytophthora sp. Chile5]|nr:hypothetical protein BBJ28_00002296 [Nothophytophthora sp. Chile5]
MGRYMTQNSYDHVVVVMLYGVSRGSGQGEKGNPLRFVPCVSFGHISQMSDSRLLLTLSRACCSFRSDIFTLGSASLTDFERIRRAQPAILSRIPLPVVNYTLTPRKRPWRAYIPEMVRFAQNLQAGKMQWPLLQQEVFPKVYAFAANVPPTSWPVKYKVRVLGYVIVFLVLLRRGITVRRVLLHAVEVLMLRYVAEQVILHLQNKSAFDMAKL